MKKILILLLLVLASCGVNEFQSTGKSRVIYPFAETHSIPNEYMRPIEFQTLGLYAADYGMYTDTSYTISDSTVELRTVKLQNPIFVQWIYDEQVKWNVNPHPYYFTTGGISSVKTYKPPFHIHVECNFLYREDILESVWLLNDIEKNPTREIDIFESGRGQYGRRLWLANHFGEPSYVNRLSRIVEVLFPPMGVNKIDLFVDDRTVSKYINGKLIYRHHLDFDYEYRILVTMIVNGQNGYNATWTLKNLTINTYLE